jgi:hypothetical protein
MAIILLLSTFLLIAICFRLLGSNAMQGDIQSLQDPKIGRCVSVWAGILNDCSRFCAVCFRHTIPPRQPQPSRHRAIEKFEIASLSSIVTMAVMVFIVAPIAIVFPLSFSGAPYLQFPPPSYSPQWYAAYFSRQDWLMPTLTSLQIAALTMVLAIALGTPAAVAAISSRISSTSLINVTIRSSAILPIDSRCLLHAGQDTVVKKLSLFERLSNCLDHQPTIRFSLGEIS